MSGIQLIDDDAFSSTYAGKHKHRPREVKLAQSLQHNMTKFAPFQSLDFSAIDNELRYDYMIMDTKVVGLPYKIAMPRVFPLN